MRYLEKSSSWRQKGEWWVPVAVGGRMDGELVLDGKRVSGWEDEKVLEVDGGDGYTTL